MFTVIPSKIERSHNHKIAKNWITVVWEGTTGFNSHLSLVDRWFCSTMYIEEFFLPVNSLEALLRFSFLCAKLYITETHILTMQIYSQIQHWCSFQCYATASSMHQMIFNMMVLFKNKQNFKQFAWQWHHPRCVPLDAIWIMYTHQAMPLASGLDLGTRFGFGVRHHPSWVQDKEIFS